MWQWRIEAIRNGFWDHTDIIYQACMSYFSLYKDYYGMILYLRWAYVCPFVMINIYAQFEHYSLINVIYLWILMNELKCLLCTFYLNSLTIYVVHTHSLLYMFMVQLYILFDYFSYLMHDLHLTYIRYL